MQIEAGKSYRDKAGRVHGPMVAHSGVKPWIAPPGGPANTWTDDGHYYRGHHGAAPNESWRDLVAVLDNPNAVTLIEEGERYLLRDGRHTGPLRYVGEGVWQDDNDFYDEHRDGGVSDFVSRIDPPPANDPVALTGERKNQHGDWTQQAGVANALKLDVRRFGNWADLSAGQQEALDMILTKVSRIVSGDPNHADHWDDIAGYAYLGKGGHGK